MTTKYIRKTQGLLMLGLLAGVLVGSLAWACSPQSRLFGITPLSGPRGTSVTMQGEGVRPGTPVEIRWNHPVEIHLNSLDGRKLGETVAGADGRFAVEVEIPDVEPGVYYLLAIPRTGETGLARNAFEVTESPASQGSIASPQDAASNTSSDLWGGFEAGRPGSNLSPGQGAASHESQSGLLVGLGLFASGFVAVVGTSAVSWKRRAKSLS